ncbi:MAG TPA: hypothetical protein VKA50_08395 [Gammaproteobacteria bacterium]|nr:hypothetical protein [Gammaproteobacteria bacterium]
MWQPLKQLLERTGRKPRRGRRRSALARLTRNLPSLYLALTAALAVLGYVWLLAFPILAIYCLVDLPDSVMAADGPLGWAAVAGEVVAAVFGTGVTVALLRLKPDRGDAGGIELQQSECPALFEHLAALYTTYGASPAHRVTLTGEMAVTMGYVPLNGFPFAPRLHLRIGLPLMAALSPEHAEGALARAIGQASLRHNRITGWLHRLHEAWLQYAKLYRLQPPKVRWLLQVCFLWYARLFTFAARYTVRRDELEGDQYALDTVNDRVVVELVSALTVYPRLLKERFWPPFWRLAYKHATPPMGPYSRLIQALPTLLQRSEPQRWLTEAMRRDGDALQPGLAERLDNIGHEHGHLPAATGGETATAALLGAALPNLCARLDKSWLRGHLAEWQQRHTKYQRELQVLKTLNARAQRGALEPREAWMHARLVAKHLDKSAAVPLFKRLVSEHPDDAAQLLEAGRLLLSCGEPAGVTALEHAMALDARCRTQAMRLIAAYRGHTGGSAADAA